MTKMRLKSREGLITKPWLSDITIAFPFSPELYRGCKRSINSFVCSLVKNLLNQWETVEKNQLDQSMKNLPT